MEVTVIVATFGTDAWRISGELVAARVYRDHGVRAIASHAGSLAVARNAAVTPFGSEWLCFLDADDDLEPGYFDAMEASTGDLRAPAVRYCHHDQPDPDPIVFYDRDIRTVNPCVIGTLIRREMFLDVGRFWDERAWEDWSLFRRAWLVGAEIVHVPNAVYRVNVNPEGRNSTVDDPTRLHREIRRSHRTWLRERVAAR